VPPASHRFYLAQGSYFACRVGEGKSRQATDIPQIALHHIETPSPNTEYGIKGVGEGGAIPPPAAIFNALNDALQGLGVELNETPLTPAKILSALAEAAPSRRLT